MPQIELPLQSVAVHRAIAKKAAENLGKFVDGNGLKADQVKIIREETTIERLGGYVSVKLVTETSKSQVKGKAPQGTTVQSAADAIAAAENQIGAMLRDGAFKEEMRSILQKDPGGGFGMEPATVMLTGQRKDFSVIVDCPTCRGNAYTSCGTCNGSGSMTCNTCRGNGFSNCLSCNGSGRVQDGSGNFIPCARCQSSGRIACAACRGSRMVSCANCRGQGRIGCTVCNQTGAFTEIYQVNYRAECSFEINWNETSSDGRAAGHKLGLRAMATEKHIEILWQDPQTRPGDIYIPCVAFLPVAKVGFSIEGHAYPATAAGLQGRIIEIEPVLDEYLKPGIEALMNLSKGPMARQALIDAACKFRLIRQTMAGLARFSQKNVYQRLNKSYPLMLSDKYARATVKYAASAMATLSARPRYQGLAGGTVVAAIFMAVYFMTPLRHALTGIVPPAAMFVLDILLWLASWGMTVLIIRYLTAGGLKKLLPDSMQINKGGLPAAGPQGWLALPATGIVWLALAASAAQKPDWIQHFIK